MALEAGTYISDLVDTNPTVADPRSEGDDHFRLIKKVLLLTFPNITGALTPTHTELNYVNGVTSAIQTQLDTKLEASDLELLLESGTAMVFFQAAAPTGWTQTTSHNDKAIRVVSGTGGGSGGSVAFETAFANQSASGTVGNTALSIAQMPAHTHTTGLWVAGAGFGAGDFINPISGTRTTSSTGSGSTHTHSFVGSSINLDVSYINLITCTRD
jgi:hypothetical protein